MLLVIDNYDSFTFNLVQYLGELATDHPLAASLRVERNDALSLEQIKELNPAAVLISPGPGTPADSGVCRQVIRELGPKVPTWASASAIKPLLRSLVAPWCGRLS